MNRLNGEIDGLIDEKTKIDRQIDMNKIVERHMDKDCEEESGSIKENFPPSCC